MRPRFHIMNQLVVNIVWDVRGLPGVMLLNVLIDPGDRLVGIIQSCTELVKVLDNLQNPSRATYQSLVTNDGGFTTKGAYPIFDNVTALFSASPVITRTATYLFACTEWIEDAFTGPKLWCT